MSLIAHSSSRSYIAVTQPIKYARHRNSKRVSITILLVWAISVAIGSPIVLGLNSTPTRAKDLCMFYNSDFIIFSSLSSFYIPCIIMVFLYWNIFKVSVCVRCEQGSAALKTDVTTQHTYAAGGVVGWEGGGVWAAAFARPPVGFYYCNQLNYTEQPKCAKPRAECTTQPFTN